MTHGTTNNSNNSAAAAVTNNLKININKKGQQVFMIKKNNLAQINPNQIQLSSAKDNLAHIVQS